MAKKRLHPGLVALSASAIAAIYTVGYIHTQSVDAAIASVLTPTAVTSVATALPTTAIATPTGVAQIVVAPSATTAVKAATAVPTAAPTATTASTAAAAYKEGTYSGAGTSRFGGVEVAVTI